MFKTNRYKAIIFPNSHSQLALIQAIRDKGYSADDFNDAFSKLFFKVDEGNFQLILAPFLRALAIDHLAFGTTALSHGFRVQYDAAMMGLDTNEPGDAANAAAFLRTQRQPYVYATDLEAGALAEMLEVTFVCTRVNQQYKASMAPCIYRKEPADNAAVIHLFNSPGDHFFIHEGDYSSTIGDGNCLYNGFAQIIRQFVLYEESDNIAVYQAQQKIYETIQHIAPMPLADLVASAKAQILTKSEATDHQLALSLAHDDIDLCKTVDTPPIDAGDILSTNLPVADPLIISDIEQKKDVAVKIKKDDYLSNLKKISQSKIDDFYTNIANIAAKATDLRKRGFIDEASKAETLAKELENKSKIFFASAPEQQSLLFPTFKQECTSKLSDENKWASVHRDYKQIFIDIIQTLTIIGAILGVLQWGVIGRYSLFPVKTKSSMIFDATSESVTQLCT